MENQNQSIFWRYISEGNAHIVIQINDTEYVLRLIKDDTKTIDLKTIQNSVNFVNYVMIPLLSDESNSMQEVICVPPAELADLGRDLEKFRPENRKFKSVLSQYTIRTLNLTLLSPKCEMNYCIEIKPKEGFISSGFSSFSKCYYCLKQHLKLEMGEIKEISSYCPLDLFSGNSERMRRALMNLFDNPQNNIKIFQNGQVVYHAESKASEFDEIIQRMGMFSSIMQFLDFIIEILLRDVRSEYYFEDMFEGTSYSPLKVRGECIDHSHLDEFPNSFLHKLLQIQKLSEMNSFDFNTIHEQSTEYVEKLLDQITSQNLNLKNDVDKTTFLKGIDPVHAALVSAVAKDCSVMICFSPNFMDEFLYIKLGKRKISYRLAVTDLEPKKAKTLLNRKKTESKMIDIYKTKIG